MSSLFITDTIALRKMMIEKGFVKTVDLAKASGIDRTTLGKILKGTAQPSSDAMYKLVAALDIPPQNAGNIFFARNLRVT